MGQSKWQKRARYLQDTANTVFHQIGFNTEDEISRAWDDDYPVDLWKRTGAKIFANLGARQSFGDEALGRIIGAGHPDNTRDDDWLSAEDIIPILELKMDTVLEDLAIAVLVAAKVNHMRGLRP